jgi:prepilin-type N-terminal cleavage/methylation domain-containing protein
MNHQRWQQEDGVSLIEVLVGVVIMAVAMSIASTAAVHAMRVQRRQIGEVDAMNRARVTMERLTREVRAANPLLAASADGTSLSVQVTRPVAGFNRKITTYTLVGTTLQMSGQLINTTTSATQTLPTTTVLTGLQLNPGEKLFSYVLTDGNPPTPTSDLRMYHSVTITLRLAMPQVSSTSTVRLTDTVTFRNAAV